MTKRKDKAPDEWDAVQSDTEYKDQMYETLAIWLQKKTGARRVGKAVTKELFELTIELIFKQALDTGYFRMPLGYGALKVREFKGASTPKIMPTRPDLPEAPTAKPGNRLHLRYTEGNSVRQALGTPGRPYYVRKTKRRSRLEDPVITLGAVPV